MTRLHKKLLVIFFALVCALCLCFGVTACKDNGKGEHKHTFDGFWLFDGAEGHYRLAACHPEVKSELEPHVDENEDNRCDFCDFVMHVHVDEDGDNICDECEQEIHKHEFAKGWTFNEKKHWHEATCEHFIERDSYVNHTFTKGVCECGVKESEVKVYGLYRNSYEFELYFNEWLEWLKDNGVTSVEINESGDGVYHYEDGHSEVRFPGERTVIAKAVSESNQPVAHVWLMVTLYGDGAYYERNGSLALGLAETDENGVAEINFHAVGGYSSNKVFYRVRIAEAKDIAGYLGIVEEEVANPIPNRYEVSGASSVGFEVGEETVTETTSEFVFSFSKGWNAYHTLELPYARYFTDPYNTESEVIEEGLTYTFTTSGDNLFDYIYFIPSNKYSFEKANKATPPSLLAIIEKNFALAASGNYKLHFEIIEGDATANLYLWDENGVNLGAYHETNPDGTPSSKYITSLSGGTAGSGHSTGGNFVNVVIEPVNGHRNYQLGLKTDKACKVKMTVERTGDYEENLADYTLNWSDGDGEQISISGVKLTAYETTTFALRGVSAGLYALTFDNGLSAKNVESLTVYTDSESNKKITVWEGDVPNVAFMDTGAQYKCVVNITEQTHVLYVVNEARMISCTAVLEKYELPTLKADENTFIPESRSVSIDSALSGEYNISVIVCGSKTITNDLIKTLTVFIGSKSVTLTGKSVMSANRYVYSGTVNIGSGDNTIKIRSSTSYSFTASVTLTKVA